MMGDIVVKARLMGKQVVETVCKEVVHGILLNSMELGKVWRRCYPQGRAS